MSQRIILYFRPRERGGVLVFVNGLGYRRWKVIQAKPVSRWNP
jgi:hypothetical protein